MLYLTKEGLYCAEETDAFCDLDDLMSEKLICPQRMSFQSEIYQWYEYMFL